MGKGKVVLLVAVALVIGFMVGIQVEALRHRPGRLAGKLDVESAPSAGELRAAFVRLEAQRIDDSLQSKVRVEMRGLTNEYVLFRCPWHSEADLAEAIGRLERSRLVSQNEGAPQGAPASMPQAEIPAKLM